MLLNSYEFACEEQKNLSFLFAVWEDTASTEQVRAHIFSKSTMSSTTNQFELTTEEQDALLSFRWPKRLGFDEGDFHDAWTRRKTALTAIELQPYADLLFAIIVRQMDTASIASSLVETCKTANHVSELKVPIWEFKHCDMPYNYRHPVGSLQHRIFLREGNPDAKKAQLIVSKGLRGLISSTVLDVETGGRDYHLQPQEIMRVLSKTDLKERLALFFGGPAYRISLERTYLQVPGVVDDDGIYPQTVKIMLHYYPSHVPEHQQKWLAKAAVKYQHYVPAYRTNALARPSITDGSEALAADDE